MMKTQHIENIGEFPVNNLNNYENADGGSVSPTGSNHTSYFLFGNIRGNQQYPLTSLQTLFIREHNYQAARLKRETPDLNDECLFQKTRNLICALFQKIIYYEFLPAIFGEEDDLRQLFSKKENDNFQSAIWMNKNGLNRAHHDPNLSLALSDIFVHAAFRLHSFVGKQSCTAASQFLLIFIFYLF